MRQKKLFVLGSFAVLLIWPLSISSGADSPALESNRAREQQTEAPTGFDNQTNGLTKQWQFDKDREVFEELETIEDGLGPVFNARGCGECHTTPITGGSSQIGEMRVGHYDGKRFIEHPGGSLLHDRAIDVAMHEYIMPGYEIRTFRMTTNLLGAGFIEAIHADTLRDIARKQPSQSGGHIAGQLIEVPVLEALEAEDNRRPGRFGWKNQHASLISFSADAYLNEMGITSPLQPTENTSIGRAVDKYDSVPDPEDEGEDIEIFARFIRATKAPPRDAELAATPEAKAGERIFEKIGCAICHLPTIVTAPPGTTINEGTFTVPEALGNKIFHPYSDFLLHNVGTGDGIVQNGGEDTHNKIRTAPLWGLRTRSRLMHDGLSLTPAHAILRHAGEATHVIKQFRDLSSEEKKQLLAFLASL